MRNRSRKRGTEGDRDEDEEAEEGTIRVKMNSELITLGLKVSKTLKRLLQNTVSHLPPFYVAPMCH